jgi:hypothetical protein
MLILIFSSISILAFGGKIKDFAPGIISLGNPDPINYGLMSRHVADFGFKSTTGFANYDLGAQTKFAWTGTMSFLASVESLGDLLNVNSAFFYLVSVTFLSSFFCVGLLVLGQKIYPARNKTGRLFQILVVTLLFSSQLNQYIIGNGFLAQLLFTSLTPHAILFLIEWHQNNKYQEAFSRESIKVSLLVGAVLGSQIVFYAPLGFLFVAPLIVLISISFLYEKFGLKAPSWPSKLKVIASLTSGLIIGLLPIHEYLGTYDSKLLVSELAKMPGWPLKNFDLFSLLPGQLLCLPGEAKCESLLQFRLDSLITLVVIVLAIVGMKSSKLSLTRISHYPILIILTYGSILTLYFIARYGIEAYPTWKFLSFLQVLAIVFFVPVMCRGVDSIILTSSVIKKKKVLKNSRFQTVFAIAILLVCDVSSLMRTTELAVRSPYAYTTPEWLARIESKDFSATPEGVNIALDGYDGMLAALYLPIENRLISKSSGYYAGIPPRYPYTITNSTEIEPAKVVDFLDRKLGIKIVRE